jgi:hypothetical protein
MESSFINSSSEGYVFFAPVTSASFAQRSGKSRLLLQLQHLGGFEIQNQLQNGTHHIQLAQHVFYDQKQVPNLRKGLFPFPLQILLCWVRLVLLIPTGTGNLL